MQLLSADFAKLHRLIVEITLLVLLLIGAYKVIRAEWPTESPPQHEVAPKQAMPPSPGRVGHSEKADAKSSHPPVCIELLPRGANVLRSEHAPFPWIPCMDLLDSSLRIGRRCMSLGSAPMSDPMHTRKELHAVGRFESLNQPADPFETGN